MGYAEAVEWIVTPTPDAAPDLLRALERPPEGATMVELRGDLYPAIDPADAVAHSPLPILYTLRSSAEGGRGPDDPSARRERLARARDAGAALLDLEAARDTGLIGALGLNPARIVLSWHDPERTPETLEAELRALLDVPAGLAKAVPTPRSLDDLCRILEAGTRLNRSRRRKRLLLFGMGPYGLASRYLAPLIGPGIAYAAWSEGAAAAPGQVPLARLRAAIGHLAGPPQAIHAVLGADVGGSLSPVLHGAGYAAAGLHRVMVPLTIRKAEELRAMAPAAGPRPLQEAAGIPVAGLAVTTPWKNEALALAARSSPRARRAGAANTLILSGSGPLAENTDADGVRGALVSAGIEAAGAEAVVQGTGGAARGAAVGLDLAGARVVLRGRDGARTRRVAGEIGVGALDPDEAAPPGAILVNATPLGRRADDPLPFRPGEIAAARAIVDMVYGGPASLAEAAARAGVPAIDGIDVLLHQGLAQFAAMTGTVPPRRAMEAAVRRFSPRR